MVMKQRVSIIIVSYNTKDLLADCLESIKSQYDAAEIETIVVDNASSDGSADHVSRAYPDVKLIRNSENKGFAAANNQGVEVSGGEYVLFLNSDTLLKDGAIEGMLDVFDKHPETGLCGPKLLNADGSVQRNVYHFTTFRAILARYTVLKYFGLFKKARDYYRMRNFDYGKFAKVDRVMGAAMMTTRKILDEVGGMDEGMFFYFEDVDLCKQINMAGYEICFTNFNDVF